MDPVSAAASIAGLATTADFLFRRVFRYIQSVTKAETEIVEYCHALQLFSGVLHRLNLQISALQEGATVQTHFEHLVFTAYHKRMQDVSSKLSKHGMGNFDSTSSGASLGRKLKWPFAKEEMKKLVADVERFKGMLESVLFADSMEKIRELLEGQEEVRNEVQNVRKTMIDGQSMISEQIRNVMQSEEDKEVLSFFGVNDADRRHEQGCQLHVEHTGTWFLEGDDFEGWLRTPHSKLWLSGIPGAGKTILASTIIGHTEKHLQSKPGKNGLAYFYCDYKDERSQQPSKILGTLAAQLAAQNKPALQLLRNHYNTYHATTRQHAPHIARETLVDVIRAMSVHFDEVSIVVDGLDECGTSVTEVVKQLFDLNRNDTFNIQMLFLSRDEHDIRRIIGRAFQNLDIAARSDDLRRYVAVEVQRRTNDGTLEFADPQLMEEVMEKLVTKAAGMFRWVACQIDYLCDLPTDRKRREALNNLPPDLHATYNRILDRINKRGKPTRILVQRTLQWLVLATRPLTKDQLLDILSIEDDSVARDLDNQPSEALILRSCSSFIRKSADGTRLELAHFTVEEYLAKLDPEDESYGSYGVYSDIHTCELARQCLIYINLEDFRDPPMDKESIQRRNEIYPFWKHACVWWASYAEAYHSHDSIFEQMKILFALTGRTCRSSWFGEVVLTFAPRDHQPLSEKVTSPDVSPLHFAAMFRSPALLSWLLDQGCSSRPTRWLGSPVHCCMFGFDGMLDFLDRPLHRPSLWYAHSIERILPALEMLLNAKVDATTRVQTVEGFSMSPIDLALLLGRERYGTTGLAVIIRSLINAGASIGSRSLKILRLREASDLRHVLPLFTRESIEPNTYQDFTQLSNAVETALIDADSRGSDSRPVSNNEASFLKSQRQLSVELNKAVRHNDLDHAQSIMDLLHEESRGPDPVVLALRHGHDEILIDLIDDKFPTHGQAGASGQFARWSVLHLALRDEQHLDVVELILSRSSSVDLHTLHLVHPLHVAASYGNVEGLRLLLKHYCSRAKSVLDLPLPGTDSRLKLAACSTAGNGQLDFADAPGATPLILATIVNSVECVALLLESGADPNARNATSGCTPLHYASLRGFLPLLDMLLDAGSCIDLRASNGATALLVAARSGQGTTARRLLEKGADRGIVDFYHYNLLDQAVYGGHGGLVADLIKQGCTSTVRTFEWSALSDMLDRRWLRGLFFASHELMSTVSWSQAKIAIFDTRNTRVLRMLIRVMGIYQRSAVTGTGSGKNFRATEFGLALAASNLEGMTLLADAGMSIDEDCCDDGPPLALACRNGDLKAVKFLLHRGALVQDKRIFDFAKFFPAIEHYILVGRHTKQWKLENVDRSDREPRPWFSRYETKSIAQIGRYGRTQDESMFDFAVRLRQIQWSFEGRVLGFHNDEVFIVES